MNVDWIEKEENYIEIDKKTSYKKNNDTFILKIQV